MSCHYGKGQGGKAVFCGCLGMLLLTLACQQAPPDTQAADQSAIKDLEIQWSKDAGGKNPDGMVSYYADDGSILPPNMATATGKPAVRAVWAEFMANPGFSANWQSTKVEVSRSGDLAYDVGTYQLTMSDPQGKQMADHGKYTVVWKKQADGKWRAAADMFNSDVQLPAPPEKKKK